MGIQLNFTPMAAAAGAPAITAVLEVQGQPPVDLSQPLNVDKGHTIASVIEVSASLSRRHGVSISIAWLL